MIETINKEEILNLLCNNLRFLQKDKFNSPDKKLIKFLIKENIYIQVKNLIKKKVFSQKDLYVFLTNKENICDKCGGTLEFWNFKIGYKYCLNCINKLETKKEIYSFLKEDMIRYGNILNNPKTLNHPIYNKINYKYKNIEDLYLYLNECNPPKCKLNECKNNSKFNSFSNGYNDFCSIKCNNKWLSYSRLGNNNPIYRMTPENKKIMGDKIRIKIKQKIKDGSWTPECTNSWCHSYFKIKFQRDGREIIQKVRSSWEAFFQLLNISFKYEKLRIPYVYKDQIHNYIVDFIDEKNKIVYELKPKSERIKEKNILKEEALIKWCRINNFQYKFISEDYFKKITINENIFKNQEDGDRLLKFAKLYFKNEN
jgi:hypothetical protein